MEKKWKVRPADQTVVARLKDQLNIHKILCTLLVQRGVDSYDAAKAYFRPSLDDLHSPWLMKDMQKAVDRITEAFSRGEKILVYGDYDVDGTTAVGCVYQFLRQQREHVDFYIPHRYREGYGISREGIDFARDNGFTLVISLDCGIKSVELISYARQSGIDFIVCDHHLPDAELPPAVAILNPKQADCPYPYKELCGCGVGYKLVSALCETWGLPPDTPHYYLDLVVTAIAADIVPITGENRVLAHFGLKRVNEAPSPGIKALIQLSGLDKTLHINSLVFVIAPRVNAAGRMDDARKAVQLFIEQDPIRAAAYAEMLHNDNSERKDADLSITREALALIESDLDMQDRKSTVVFQPHWHKGVVGIVASRLIDRYYRPTIVLTQSGDIVAGSARSVIGFNVYEAVHRCKDLLIGYGGHFYAAGLTMARENIDAFTALFEAVVSESITEEMLTPELSIDAEVSFSDLVPLFYNILCQMEPFGPDNMRPLFVVRRVYDTGYSKIVKEDHLRFVLRQGDVTFTGIGFNLAAKYPLLAGSSAVDVVFTLDENEWNGEKNLQLKVVDVRRSEFT
ncbi:MAG TPA: single-stranded-DNA-specific exonuclease RecJ [Dinghuibacter sp.]|uniref:single-stranded-DNA-specific exonuclease RecJ n=1 Tax=Dinghuibacter sp. TaxID=2024697 RepID=UPI002BF839DE|nr:single-stranded-DNA-specific exonuclease RecJ [Dinghuibacter sp.]HTJ13669.1 single-stranded-DNA-specific exonuclease RecJ [Dinghuibacter sp.]